MTVLIRSLSLFIAASLSGCGDTAVTPAPDLGPRSTFTESEAAAARAACTFKDGTAPGLSLAKDAPLGSQIPIDTIVILMMENRSFDNVLQDLASVGQPDADVAPPGSFNLDSMGQKVEHFHETAYCLSDTDHSWAGSHRSWNGGKNDGFVITNENPRGSPTDGRRAMGYYTSADLPFFYGLSSAFAISDRHFCSLLSETFPNRKFLYAATTFGDIAGDLDSKPRHTIFSELDDAGIDWALYAENPARPSIGIFLDAYVRHLNQVPKFATLFDDAAAGMLPRVTFVEPALDTGEASDDFHPPGDVQKADAFVERIVTTLIHSPQWPHMALFITFDEHGGLYDHVPPPQACPPDATEPALSQGDPQGKFDRYGFRVPLIVVSPYAKPHSVSHVVSDQTSILRFIEARHLLPSLTARDGNADPLFSMFDFKKPALLAPPALPHAAVDDAAYRACVAKFQKPDGGVMTDGGMADGGAAMDGGAGDAH